MKRRRTWRRRLIWAAGGLSGGVLLLWAVLTGLMWHWVAKPPPVPSDPASRAAVQAVPEKRGDRVYLGRNWLGRRAGLPVLYLTGTPLEMGVANGQLTQAFIARQEEVLVQMFHRVAPYSWTRFLLKFVLVYKNRHLSANVIEPHQMEMLGLTLGCPDPHPELGPYFHRVLNYHAAQDISYMLMNSPLLRGGCTSFGAWGSHTAEGRLLLGRNFDWEPDRVFDEDRMVILCEPADGIPFVSLAWAGMVGCVSGMNREGLAVAVNGAPSELPGAAATPTCLVAREVLQHAGTLAEAQEIIRRRQVFVSALFLIGSRRDGRCVVVEKTPETMAVRDGDGQNWIVCANHYLTPGLKETPLNREYTEEDTSLARQERMNTLLQAASGRLEPNRCAEILRDRRLPGGEFAGNGHRQTLNPLIATHAVIMDLTRGIFWAATSPHQLGRFVPFDVRDFEKEHPERSVPADPILSNGEFARYRTARATLDQGWQAIGRKEYALAVACARRAETNNPGFYQNAWLLAEGLFGQGHYREAARACGTAQERRPALGSERGKVQALARAIAQAQAKASAPAPAENRPPPVPGASGS